MLSCPVLHACAVRAGQPGTPGALGFSMQSGAMCDAKECCGCSVWYAAQHAQHKRRVTAVRCLHSPGKATALAAARAAALAGRAGCTGVGGASRCGPTVLRMHGDAAHARARTALAGSQQGAACTHMRATVPGKAAALAAARAAALAGRAGCTGAREASQCAPQSMLEGSE